jgi:hypothetical protein
MYVRLLSLCNDALLHTPPRNTPKYADPSALRVFLGVEVIDKTCLCLLPSILCLNGECTLTEGS